MYLPLVLCEMNINQVVMAASQTSFWDHCYCYLGSLLGHLFFLGMEGAINSAASGMIGNKEKKRNSRAYSPLPKCSFHYLHLNCMSFEDSMIYLDTYQGFLLLIYPCLPAQCMHVLYVHTLWYVKSRVKSAFHKFYSAFCNNVYMSDL